MSWFRNGFQARHSSRSQPRSAHLAVEQLETREVLSAANVAVASGIIRSAESFQNFVTQDYLQFLRRAPDPVGLTFWGLQLERGLAPEVVDAAFVSSPEYLVKHGANPTGFLVGLYTDLLGRFPSTLELNFWLTQLARGATASQVALAFTTSAEREALVITQDYVAFLRRVPEPAGLAFWLNQIQLGANQEGVAVGIVGSTEFFLGRGGDNRDFIIGAYQDVLRRTPSPAEIDFWLVVMNRVGNG